MLTVSYNPGGREGEGAVSCFGRDCFCGNVNRGWIIVLILITLDIFCLKFHTAVVRHFYCRHCLLIFFPDENITVRGLLRSNISCCSSGSSGTSHHIYLCFVFRKTSPRKKNTNLKINSRYVVKQILRDNLIKKIGSFILLFLLISRMHTIVIFLG